MSKEGGERVIISQPWCFGWQSEERRKTTCTSFLLVSAIPKPIFNSCPYIAKCREATKKIKERLVEFVKVAESIIGRPITTTGISTTFSCSNLALPLLRELAKEGRLVEIRRGRGSSWRKKVR